MSDTPRPLTGILRDGQGTVLPNRSLTWYRVPRKVLAQGSSVIVDELFTTQTDGSGQITGTALVPGKYLMRTRLADQDRYVEVSVPEGSGSVNIADLIDTAAPPITPPLVAAAQEARDQAQTAAGQSAASAEASEASADRAGRWGVYVDTASGLAATEDGDFFSVYDADAEILLFFENVSGTAVDVASIEAVQDFDSDQIANESGIIGDTVTEALDALDAAKQPVDDDLTALAALAGTGLLARTGAGTAAARSITGGGAVQVSHGNGVAENPVISVPVQDQNTWSAGSDDVESAINAQKLAGAIAARAGGVVDSGTFTTASEVDIALPAGWFEAEIVLRVTAASTSDSSIDARFTRDAFASVLSGASDYRWATATVVYAAVAGAGLNSSSDNKMRVNPSGSSAGLGTSPLGELILTLRGYASAGFRKRLRATGCYINAAGSLSGLYSADGFLIAANNSDPVNGIRLFPGAGTITGNWTLALRGRIA